ncbi:MAG: spermidine synthase [Pseudomonadota bacterium]|jgi:spermidine synthase
MTPDINIALTEMSVCVALCSIPEPKNGLVSPQFLELVKSIEPELEFNAKPYDVVILDSMPLNLSDLKESMNKKGVLVCKIGNGDIESAKEALKTLSSNFRIAMPFLNLGLAFASDFYHPTADIVLQKADLIDDLSVYNSDYHKASFALPTWQIKALLGIAKN